MRYFVFLLTILFADFAVALECKLLRVIDGDTISCRFGDIPDFIGQEMSVRFRGYDAPEIRTRDKLEREAGLKAKDELQKYLMGFDKIKLSNISRGKYFRLIADKPGVQIVYAKPTFKCGTKTKCSQMSSCKEAYFFLKSCGLRRLDRDKDGVPCESICR